MLNILYMQGSYPAEDQVTCEVRADPTKNHDWISVAPGSTRHVHRPCRSLHRTGLHTGRKSPGQEWPCIRLWNSATLEITYTVLSPASQPDVRKAANVTGAAETCHNNIVARNANPAGITAKWPNRRARCVSERTRMLIRAMTSKSM